MESMKYKVVEIFSSMNGEGPLAGELAVFIRFAGCNLQCAYCDTRWANEDHVSYQEMTGEELYRYVKATGLKNVTLTGGEPLIQPGISELLQLLCADPGLSIEIETNGSIGLKQFCKLKPNRPRFTMDYKLGSGDMESKMALDNFEILTPKDAVKFVVGNITDLERAREIIAVYHLTKLTNVFISPVYAQINPAEIVSYMKEHKMNSVRLQIQLHKVIWDPAKRGV